MGWGMPHHLQAQYATLEVAWNQERNLLGMFILCVPWGTARYGTVVLLYYRYTTVRTLFSYSSSRR